MTDFFGARETSGKAVMLGSAEQNRYRGKADWSICLGQFLYKVKRERVLLNSPGRKSGTQDRCSV